MLLEGMITHPHFQKDILSSCSATAKPYSRQELTVDQQARLCSHIGFTGDKAPQKGSKVLEA